MRYEHYSARVFAQSFQQDILGAHVEVISGFVEQEEICRMEQHPQEGVAVALTA